jgi:uncharacterized protein YbbC (DUF1343 family)
MKNYKFTTAILAILFIGTNILMAQTFCNDKVQVGAARMDEYLSLLKGKQVGIVMNQSSLVGNSLLVDTLLKRGVAIKKIFAPEHGFRGTADAGEHLNNGIDSKTGLAIVSLYGEHRMPTKEDLEDIDIILYDLQDVGVRFYTYLGTLDYVMHAAAIHHKQVIVLDRPNPNGFYVDGPMPSASKYSFVCMHKVPVVHGMTAGEYAQMINGESWMIQTSVGAIQCDLKVIPCKNYTHKDFYQLMVKPSPNLANMRAIYLYPSLCWFEGTPVSLGRGTDKAFQIYGSPALPNTNFNFQFTPTSRVGAKNPPCLNQLCNGEDLTTIEVNTLQTKPGINLEYLYKAYHAYPNPDKFFTSFFNTLDGGDLLQTQIKEGLSPSEIKASWTADLIKFKQIRKKYLLYDDFE